MAIAEDTLSLRFLRLLLLRLFILGHGSIVYLFLHLLPPLLLLKLGPAHGERMQHLHRHGAVVPPVQREPTGPAMTKADESVEATKDEFLRDGFHLVLPVFYLT